MNKHTIKGILIGVLMSLLLTVSVSSIGISNTNIAQELPTNALLKVYYTVSSIKVDNSAMTLNEKPFIHQGRTYVPLRAISENLGCQVHWDAYTKNIDIYKDTVMPIYTPTPTVKPIHKPTPTPKLTPKPTVKPTPTETKDEFVYITKTGTKYHKLGAATSHKVKLK